MLKINRLKMKNFMCVDEAELHFDDTQVIVLQGQNGQGKSAVFECIALCLSENKRSLKYNEYVKIGTDEAKIELDCLLSGKPLSFRVTLHYEKGSSFERSATYEGKTYTNSEVSTLIKDLELDFYSNILFTMQHEDAVSEMSSAWRAHYLQKLFQFDFSEESTALKEEISGYEKTKSDAEMSATYLQKAIDEKMSLIATVPELPFTEEEIEHKRLDSVECEKKLAEKSDLQQKVLDSANRKSSIEQKISAVKNEQTTQESYLRRIDEKTTQLSSLKIPEIPEEPSKLEYENSLRKLEEDEEYHKKSMSDDTNVQITMKSNLSVLDTRRKLEEAGKCPTCGQSTEKVFDDSTKKEYEQLKLSIEENQKNIKEHQSMIDSIARQKDTLKNEYSSKLYEYRTAVNTQSVMTTRKQELESDIKELKAKLVDTDYSKELEELNKELAVAKEEIADLQSDISEVSALQSRKNLLDRDINSYASIVSEVRRVENSNQSLKEKIADDKVRKQHDEDASVEATQQLGYCNEAYKVLTQTLPNFLIVKTCALIEKEMNTFMQTVFPTWRVLLRQNRSGVDFFYTKDLSCDLTKKSNLRNVRMASGFEKSMLSIAFKVALTKAYNLSFAVLDEVDSDADDENSERMFEQLIESDIFEQIFIITHKAGTRSFIRSASKTSKFYNVVNGHFTETEGDE